MTTILQQQPAMLPPQQVAPLRSLVNSQYGQATIQACSTVWTAASGSPYIVNGVQSVIAAGVMAKKHLPESMERSIDENLSTACSLIEKENLDKTIDQIDHIVDEKLVEARTKITNVADHTKSSFGSSVDGAKTKINHATERAKNAIGDAQTQLHSTINETVLTARTEITNRVTESLVAVDQNKHVNSVVSALEPAVLSVVNFVLPEDAEGQGQGKAVQEEENPVENPKREYALKKTLRLTDEVQQRVSKAVQKRWLAASLQLDANVNHITARTDEVQGLIASNGVDLIAYSEAFNSNCTQVKDTIYDTYVVSTERVDALAKAARVSVVDLTSMEGVMDNLDLAAILAKGKECAHKVSENVGEVVKPAGAFAHEQLSKLGALGVVQLDRYGPILAPLIAPALRPVAPVMIRVTSKIAIIFGVNVDEEKLRQHPLVHKLSLFAQGKNMLAEAKVESMKEIKILETNADADAIAEDNDAAKPNQESEEEEKEDVHENPVACVTEPAVEPAAEPAAEPVVTHAKTAWKKQGAKKNRKNKK